MALKDPMHWILDAELREVPCSNLWQWAYWFEKNHQLRIVAQEYVGPHWVSTVFLGLDHNYAMTGPPLLYETMIFYGDSENDELIERYSTWTQAALGHRQTVAILKAKLNTDRPL